VAAVEKGKSEVDRLPPMGRYVFGLLRRTSDVSPIGEKELERIQEGHLGHLRKLRESGELIASGPLEEAGDLRGVLIFRTESVEHARELMRGDPAIVSGRLTLDAHRWYAPAGLATGGVQPPSPESPPGRRSGPSR